MYLAIFIFVIIILILAIDIEINVKSADDTLKIDAKVGLIRFVIPHQRLISKAMEKEQLKNKQQQRDDFKKLFKNRHYLNRLFKHSSLTMFYIARFTKEELYLNPILNGAYLMVSNQIHAYLNHHFKMVDKSNIKLLYDEHYENIDYFICVKSDLISILAAILIRK
ncbi:MAG: hypothetical protein K2N64_04585 [Anaeroplasmataceae bacterium]|nr:hypothetical protein [Anaeroplasmataceae bacterium]